MKRKTLIKVSRAVLVMLVSTAIIVGLLREPTTQASDYQASYIEMLEGIKNDYSSFVDSSVMFELPSNIKPGEDISVIITLDVENLLDAYEKTDKTVPFSEYVMNDPEAAKLSADIADEKDAFLAKLDEAAIAYETGEDYNILLSGFELVIKARDFKATCKNLSAGQDVIVSEVYNVAETQLVENDVNVYETGIFNSEDSGYDGTGMVVAVLDTGVDSAHSAFSVKNFTSTTLGLTYDQVAALINKTTASTLVEGLTADDVYINEKIPFGFDYADKDVDVYSTHNNHGTHVSGVIVGKDDVITGVAPNAQLVSMKIFSDVMDTARATWILSALEDCVVLDVDVINMSIGTSCGFGRESDEEKLNGVYDRIREAGISMVVAASNSYSSAYGSEANGNLGLTSNPDTGTVGSPSTYDGVMSVASINGVETPYIKYGDKIVYFLESTNGASKENKFVETLLGDSETKEMEYVVIPGVGRTADYTGLDVKGKIALVRRGSNTFEEKAIIAQAQGAAGIIIYNNVSGDIKMNVGEATLAVCSISQDDGEVLAAAGSGKITVSTEQTSGPFMSDFSSWGPGPSLEIKPEITAHGGNILSAITGGSYDRLSGTSMACPNLAGFVALLRQYVFENFPEIADDSVKVNAMVYCLLMSTADIVMNKNGLPYAVRKQGAGLANLMNAIQTKAYITTYGTDGKAMDKTKIELGDDPDKKGVYELNFTVTNFGSADLSYNIGTYVMTEGVSDTKTSAGETTVTEEGYLLNGASVAISATGGTLDGTNLTVGAGKAANVKVVITLSEEDKNYLNTSFANGMYVEGFVTLSATAGTEIDMSVPYLAYYGDWTVAPLFDLNYFETNADELNDAIADEDKTRPDAYATRPIGGVSQDYVSYLGSYYFLQDPKDMVISANPNYVALSNQEGTIHSLRFVWAGLLRNAERIEVTITDDTTGEVIFETVDDDVRKSYGDGGTPYPANVEIEFDTMDYNLANNTEYTVTLTGYLDYGDGGIDTNEKNVFSFPLTVDFEAPTVTGTEFYYEYDENLKKNRLYAKVAIYDNHYAMSSQIGYVTMGTDEDGNAMAEMKAFEQYMTPVYSQCDSTTYVTYELTDYIYEIKENSQTRNSFVVTCYDYALNSATYEIGLPDEYVDFYFDGLDEGLTLSPNEVYTLDPLVYPDTEWAELLEFASSKPSVVRVVNNKIVAVQSGSATVKVQDPASGKSVTFKVTVLAEGDEGYRRYDKPVADVFTLKGYNTLKAYYMLNSEDKKIGEVGDTRFFEGNYSLELYPSESVLLNYDLDAFFPNDTTVEFASSNESIVTITEGGVVTAVAEGFASVSVKVMQDGKSTYYSESVAVEVKDPFVTTGSSLTHYYGNGGLVSVPADLTLTEIGSFAFSNYDYIPKTEEELEFDDAETSKQWYIGESTITKVVLPEGIERIGAYAFANLTALEEIVLPSTLEAIEYGAFYGCTALKKISFSGENNLKIINKSAFENCDLQESVDLTAACVVGDYAFAGNTDMKEVSFSETLLSIGQYAFAGCKGLTSVKNESSKVKFGAYAFTACESLENFYVNAAVLPEGMFYECKSMTKVVIGPDVNMIGEFAFRDTAIATFEVMSGNKAYVAGVPQNAPTEGFSSGNFLLSADGKQLVAVAPVISGAFTEDTIGGMQVSSVARGAFSHNTKITSIVLPQVTEVYGYAFASNKLLNSVSLGDLTYIGEYAYFETSITQLPAFTAETEIGKYAFAFTAVTSVTIPDGMVLAEGVFSECMKLTTVVIGNNVTVGDYAFSLNKDNVFEVKSYTVDGKKRFYYIFNGSLNSLTIGENAVLGKSAFAYQASLEQVTLGAGAQIGEMAFYNNESLKDIDLSAAVSIGDYAFSGDVYYICMDDSMTIAAVGTDGYYMYTYHGPALEKINLSAASSIGKHAFSYCRDLMDAVLGSEIIEVPEYAFAGCESLVNINLDKVVTIGTNAFSETALKKADLSSAETIGEYAFVYNEELAELVLGANGTTMEEGAFSYCTALSTLTNEELAKKIGDYAFAYTSLVDVDLTAATYIGTHAFLKEEKTPFKVVLGESIEEMGDNPFALCELEPFSKVTTETFNGVEYTSVDYSYIINDSVKVVDGSVYCKTVNGYELIAYAGIDGKDVHVAEDTVRITAMAFAGSDVISVTLPYTVGAIGHKAFYDCDDLKMVVFGSFEAPVLEEEFDPKYYDTLDHIPGSGDFGTYTDYDGNEVIINGLGIIPYFMWNATGGQYSNVFYGANFADYIGFVKDKLVMVRPSNGQNYETFIYGQYFEMFVDGTAAADDITLAAIAAIAAIPERVTYEDKAIVQAARDAYAKIATTEQQALVTNYADLISAEQRITALTPTEEAPAPAPEQEKGGLLGMIGIIAGGVALAGGAVGGVVYTAKKRRESANGEA